MQDAQAIEGVEHGSMVIWEIQAEGAEEKNTPPPLEHKNQMSLYRAESSRHEQIGALTKLRRQMKIHKRQTEP